MDISVIIPIFNMETCLKRCLESLRLQSYTEIEVIMINDGSEDASEKICLEYVKKDSRFVYYTQVNQGVSAARNKGLEVAKGEWITFVDPDDYLEFDMIQKLYKEIEEGCDVICCCCWAEAGSKTLINTFFSEDMLFDKNKELLFLQLLDSHYQAKEYRYTAIGVPWGKLYRKTFITQNGLSFDLELKRMQDNVFNFRAFSLAEKVKYINQALYHYTVNHIHAFMYMYDKDAVDYLPKVLCRQKEIIEEFLLSHNKLVKRFFVKEVILLFILAVQKSYYNCLELSDFEKKKMTKELLIREPFRSLLESYFPVMTAIIFKCIVNSGFLGKIIWIKIVLKKSILKL